MWYYLFLRNSNREQRNLWAFPHNLFRRKGRQALLAQLYFYLVCFFSLVFTVHFFSTLLLFLERFMYRKWFRTFKNCSCIWKTLNFLKNVRVFKIWEYINVLFYKKSLECFRSIFTTFLKMFSYKEIVHKFYKIFTFSLF